MINGKQSLAGATANRLEEEKMSEQLPPEIQALINQHHSAVKQAEQTLKKLPHVAPETLLHTLRDLLLELEKTKNSTPASAAPAPAHQAFMAAYEDVMGELDQLNFWDDPESWAESYPVLLRRLKFALQSLARPQSLEKYSAMFQDYCRAGGKGHLTYEQALEGFAALMQTDVAQLPDDDDTVIALRQLEALRRTASELFATLPTTSEQYASAKASFERLMEVLAFEGILAFPHYDDEEDSVMF